MKSILVINGPNLNMLGERDTNIYGGGTLEEINGALHALAKQYNIEVTFFQSNHEGGIIDRLQELAGFEGVIINPGAYAHYSIAIRDAIECAKVPVIEVHISNIYRREEFRRVSVTASACKGQITGLGAKGYELALLALL